MVLLFVLSCNYIFKNDNHCAKKKWLRKIPADGNVSKQQRDLGYLRATHLVCKCYSYPVISDCVKVGFFLFKSGLRIHHGYASHVTYGRWERMRGEFRYNYRARSSYAPPRHTSTKFVASDKWIDRVSVMSAITIFRAQPTPFDWLLFSNGVFKIIFLFLVHRQSFYDNSRLGERVVRIFLALTDTQHAV